MSRPIRNAVVTGGGKGIGLGIAKGFAERGIGVAIWGRTADVARAAADEINAAGGRAFAYAVDVANAGAVDETARRCTAEMGPIHILVNNAGICPIMSLRKTTEDVYDRVLDVNLKGPFNCTRALTPGMLEAGWGRVINISSLAGQMGGMHMSAYGASKAGLFGLTKAVAREFGTRGITCNCICPSTIDTPLYRETVASGYMTREEMEALTMVGRIGTVEEMAAACLYFVSEEAGFVTGQILGVNGGQYI